MIVQDPIVSPHLRIRYPESFTVGHGSIVDDFSYFSTQVRIGRYCHVASGCSVAGGPKHLFELGDYSSLSSGVKIWCSSNDFAMDLITIIPEELGSFRQDIEGDVRIGRYTGIGSNSVIMPENVIPEGSVIGALSFVPQGYAFEPWMVYAGIPIRPIRARDRERVLSQLQEYKKRLKEFSEKPVFAGQPNV